jgi:hypothetical protein
MTNINTEGLPPEMQARIAQIIEGAKQKHANEALPAQPAAVPQSAMIAPKPSLMDHTMALRQEVAVLNQQVAAMGQVVDAVGQAVGQLYAMFQQQTTPSNYSTAFQAQQPNVEDSDY